MAMWVAGEVAHRPAAHEGATEPASGGARLAEPAVGASSRAQSAGVEYDEIAEEADWLWDPAGQRSVLKMLDELDAAIAHEPNLIADDERRLVLTWRALVNEWRSAASLTQAYSVLMPRTRIATEIRERGGGILAAYEARAAKERALTVQHRDATRLRLHALSSLATQLERNIGIDSTWDLSLIPASAELSATSKLTVDELEQLDEAALTRLDIEIGRLGTVARRAMLACPWQPYLGSTSGMAVSGEGPRRAD
jgi:hypothetical protein